MDGKDINILKLINIDAKNKKLIYKFYEFIMIMLKLKFYEYAITNLSTIQTEDVIPIIGGGTTERKLIGYMNSTARNSLSKLSHKNNNLHHSSHLHKKYITPKKYVTPKKHIISKNQKKTKNKKILDDNNKLDKHKHKRTKKKL